MKNARPLRVTLLLAPLTTLTFAGSTQAASAPEGTWSLWYPKAAANWNEALPVGNGRLGAMVFGGAESRIEGNRFESPIPAPRPK